MRFGPGDFAVRQVRDVDPVCTDAGRWTSPVEVGATVQFLGERRHRLPTSTSERSSPVGAVAGALALVDRRAV